MTAQIDFEQARFNMIEQQIRTWEVFDQNVLELLDLLHREDFVPEAYRQFALADMNIPLAHDQLMMTPKIEARLLQVIAAGENDNVLEIGTGSGYLTALLAKCSRHVHSIDIYADFLSEAKTRLDKYGIANVQFEAEDLFKYLHSDKKYDAIVVTGSLPNEIPALQQMLAIGGRLFLIVGLAPIMEAKLISRVGDSEWASESLFETYLPALIGAEIPSAFRF